MKNILIIFAHPAPNKSGLNRHLAAEAAKLKNVEVRELYELYPNLHIDVRAEQEALRRADVLVFQFPVQWFSSPAILKEWQDSVLTNGFAYGDGERALRDKEFLLAVSTGGSPESYQTKGRHGAPLSQYLAPFEQTARFCDMKIIDPFTVQNAGDLTPDLLQRTVQNYTDVLIQLGKYHYGS